MQMFKSVPCAMLFVQGGVISARMNEYEHKSKLNGKSDKHNEINNNNE